MKKISVSTLALVVALGSAMPTLAQQTETRIEGETALQMATRLGLCGDAGVRSAQFVDGGTSLQANCVSRVAGTTGDGGGGLGAGGLVATGVGIAAVIGIAAASSSSSGTN